jgi:hypothetical protein
MDEVYSIPTEKNWHRKQKRSWPLKANPLKNMVEGDRTPDPKTAREG